MASFLREAAPTVYGVPDRYFVWARDPVPAYEKPGYQRVDAETLHLPEVTVRVEKHSVCG